MQCESGFAGLAEINMIEVREKEIESVAYPKGGGGTETVD